MAHITIRYRTRRVRLAYPPFSDRDTRSLSAGNVLAEHAPDGFADVRIPALGETLAQSVYLSGLLTPPALCSGLGRCGLCRVRFLADPPLPLAVEREALSHHDLDTGWRLACRHAPEEGMHVLIPALGVPEQAEEQSVAVHHAPGARPLALAVDLGTTSICWEYLARGDAAPGTPGGTMINPQMGAGSDSMSRIAYASTSEGAAALRRLVLDGLARVREGCGEGCVAANPAMTAILLGNSVSGLACAPYRLDYKGGVTEILPGLFPVWIPPQVSPFIGGDVSAGYAAITLDPCAPRPEFPFLLADLGTNGECLLALDPQTALAASMPLGPALEGINLSFGTNARPGAVTGYSLTPQGLAPSVMGGGAANGITATGYLSLLRALRSAGVLNENGLFAPSGGARRMPHAEPAQTAGEPRIRLPEKMFLTASDVEEILKVKAAFTLAVSRLLAEASLPVSRLKGVYLAGALGTHAPLDALYGLGFLPPGLTAPVHLPGNTSLAGARLFLASHAARDTSILWAERIATLDLAGDKDFTARYAAHMTFVWQG